MDRARLQELRAEHYEKDARIVYRDGRPYYCPKCDTSWPCEQSQILDLALGAEAFKAAAKTIADEMKMWKGIAQESNPEVTAVALEAERLRAALTSAQTVMRVLLAPGEHTSGCGCPEAVCVLRRETWSQIESTLAGTEGKDG